VKPDEARELILLVPTKVLADLLLLLVTLFNQYSSVAPLTVVSFKEPSSVLASVLLAT
jgi:hypothetical protein